MGIWCRSKLYTAGKWIVAQLTVMAVTWVRTPVPVSPTQRSNTLSYLHTSNNTMRILLVCGMYTGRGWVELSVSGFDRFSPSPTVGLSWAWIYMHPHSTSKLQNPSNRSLKYWSIDDSSIRPGLLACLIRMAIGFISLVKIAYSDDLWIVSSSLHKCIRYNPLFMNSC